MYQIDQKFKSFSLETYDPNKEEIVKISTDDFSGKWMVLFFYPADFTFVCPTEFLNLNKHFEEFSAIGGSASGGKKCEIVVVSTDSVYTHKAWIEMEELLKGFKYHMAADHNAKLSRELGIYDEESGMAQRAVFIIDPDGILRSCEIVADAIGRNASEILRKLRALDFVKNNPGKVCPASWDEGGVVLEPSIKKAGKVYKEWK